MTVTIRNYKGHFLRIIKLDETRWLIKPEPELEELPVRAGSYFIEFSGGPYIANGTMLSELCEDLPDVLIDAVSFEAFDRDKSGYEYFGYVIHTYENE